jgi:hypothetical protein
VLATEFCKTPKSLQRTGVANASAIGARLGWVVNINQAVANQTKRHEKMVKLALPMDLSEQ